MRKAYKIIHLDDNPVFFKVMERNLRRIKEIEIIYKAAPRIEKIKQMININDLPDLFISDLMLENDYDASQGINFVKKMNKDYPSLNIMVLSARSDLSIQEELKPYIIKYQTKTFLPRQFRKDLVDFLKESSHDR
jgi:response regulator of citrate/malate metabolism